MFAPGFAGFRPPRPLGITILVILQIVIGVIDILIGTLLLLGYYLAAPFFGFGMLPGFGLFLIPLALLSFIFGFFAFILAYGLWMGQGWAWISSIILAVIGLAVSLVGLIFGSYSNIIPLILYALILIYLCTYNVRAFFGRARWGAVPYPGFVPPVPPPQYAQPPPIQGMPVQQPYYSPPQQLVQPSFYPPPQQPMSQGPLAPRTSMCPNCLSPLTFGATFCSRCGAQFR